jgi:tRNA 2-thiocytidine biosynthesis protein TtcA
MLKEWEKRWPGRIETLFRSMQNVVPSHLADATLFDFKSLKAEGAPYPDGDIAFDPEPLPASAHDGRFALSLDRSLNRSSHTEPPEHA